MDSYFSRNLIGGALRRRMGRPHALQDPYAIENQPVVAIEAPVAISTPPSLVRDHGLHAWCV